MNDKLEIVVQESGLETSRAKEIQEQFDGFLKRAESWEKKAKAIVVTKASQTGLMQNARDARLVLKDIRVEAEKIRKKLKERSLREGKAIDGISNVIKHLIVPIEEYLLEQEQFAQRVEEQKAAKELEGRKKKLLKYVDDLEAYSLEGMSSEVFDNLLAGCKSTHEKKLADEKQAEEERIKAEQKVEEDRVAMEKENEKLKKEAEIKDKKIEKERKERVKEQEAQRLKDEQIVKEREVQEAKITAEKEAREQQEKDRLEEERLEKEKRELVIKEREDRERVRIQELEDKLKKQAIRTSLDGDKICVLFGPNLQEGVAGFGKTIEEAITDFCTNWAKRK